MTNGHKQAQRLFEIIGLSLGFKFCQNWSQSTPGDGSWLWNTCVLRDSVFPIATIEVAVSESLKRLRGSISTIELISPSLGVLLIQEEEIRRGLLRKGIEAVKAENIISNIITTMEKEVSMSKQRIEIWTMKELRARANFCN
jgi:hypothetical protein